MKRAVPLVLIALVGGCGYHWGYGAPAGVRTVDVRIFDNPTVRCEHEFPLTERLVSEIQSKTGLRVAQTDPDSTLTATITDFRQKVLTESRLDTVTEEAVLVKVHVSWRDNRTGKSLFDEEIGPIRAEVHRSRGENLAGATDEAFGDLVEEIVRRMERVAW